MLKASRKEIIKELSIVTKYEAFFTGGKIQFTNDGQRLLCSCSEQVKVVNVNDGKVISTIGSKESDEELTSFLLANDDETLITAAKNGILKQWNLTDKTLTRTWKSLHNGKVACMTFDATDTLLATGGSDSTIKVWDIHKKYCTHNLKGSQGVFSIVSFKTIDSNLYIFGAADDYKINVWDLTSSIKIASLESHCSTITGLLFVEKHNKLISCSRDKVIIVWDLNSCLTSEKPLRIIPIFEAVESIFLVSEDILSSLVTSSVEDDIYFMTAGEKGLLRVWAASTGKCLFNQTNSLVAPPVDSDYDGLVITQALYVPEQNVISVTTFEHNIVLYKTPELELDKQFVGYNDDVLAVKFMGKGDSHLAVATNSSNIKVYELATFSCQLLKGHLDIVQILDVFPREPYMLLSGSKDNSVRVWLMDANTKEVSNIFVGYGHTHSVAAVACCKGKSKFFLSGSDDMTLKLWNVPSKIHLVALKQTINARCTIKAHDKLINSIDVSLNDKVVATGSQDSTAKIWDSSDLSLVGTLRGHKKGVWAIKFSPVDVVVATASGDQTVKIWSLSDYSILKTFAGHEFSVLNVLFLSRGMQLISSGADGLLKLWDIKSTECIKTYEGHTGKTWALTASADGEFIVSGGADSNIVLWRDVTKEEEQKELLKQQEFILREQDLANLILKKKWKKALRLAIVLEQPFRALNVTKEILLEANGSGILEETIMKLEPYQIESLLGFAVEWNTNSKNYIPAQIVLKTYFKMQSTENFLKMSNRQKTVEGLLPYTDRHFHRLNKLLQEAHILNFLWQTIKVTNADVLEE